MLTHCSAAGSSRGAPYTDHADRRHPHQQREQQDSTGSELDSGAQREVPTRNHERDTVPAATPAPKRMLDSVALSPSNRRQALRRAAALQDVRQTYEDARRRIAAQPDDVQPAINPGRGRVEPIPEWQP